jgi:hypothetical protein
MQLHQAYRVAVAKGKLHFLDNIDSILAVIDFEFAYVRDFSDILVSTNEGVISCSGLSLLSKQKIISIIPLELANSENIRFAETDETFQMFRACKLNNM